MNNEPVAWRKVVGNVTKHYQYNEMGEGTPLYLHPAKTLTDEEIHECWEMFMGTDDYTRIDIARAILRKAQEK
jgi:hypothetical protein